MKTKQINWQPQHFPVGTVVVLGKYEKVGNEFHFSNNGGAEVTVMECINNGPDSWLIKTDAWNESLGHFHSFNFSHITRIKTRGNSPVKLQGYHGSVKPMINLKSEVSIYPLNKNRYYTRSIQELVNYLVKTSILPRGLSVKEGFLNFFLSQSFVNKTDKGWNQVFDFDKKKAKRFIRQNINRWIKPMKEVRIEAAAEAKCEYEKYCKEMEADWYHDFDAMHPDLNEEPAPVPADHFYGLADLTEVETMQNDDRSPKVNHF